MGTVNVGDVVVLKSGGPKMTVTQKGGNHRMGQALSKTTVVCQWFTDSGFVSDCTCDEVALVKVTESASSVSDDERPIVELTEDDISDEQLIRQTVRTAEFRHYPKSQGGDT